MPLTLDSTAALRGQKHRHRFTLVVTSHGRWRYLDQALAVFVNPHFFERRILSVDGSIDIPERFGRWFTNTVTTGPERKGLTANLAQAWGALTLEDDKTLHLEEDFILHDAPLDAMADVLEANPGVAQMALVRQPWSAEEHHAGGMLHGPHFQGDLIDEGGWMRQFRLFTLNPFVARASLLRTLRPSVESGLTEQLRARGYGFGFWGSLNDPPRVEHLGAEGGMGSPGWLP